MFFERNDIFFAPENMKISPLKVAQNWTRPFFQYCQLAQIQPKSQFLFHKNLPPRDFSIMTMGICWGFIVVSGQKWEPLLLKLCVSWKNAYT